MITNGTVTLYHKTIDSNYIEKWTKQECECWSFVEKGTNQNKGYSVSNKVYVRIPYNQQIQPIHIEDIIFIGKGPNVTEITELSEWFTVTKVDNNNFGKNAHVYVVGE